MHKKDRIVKNWETQRKKEKGGERERGGGGFERESGGERKRRWIEVDSKIAKLPRLRMDLHWAVREEVTN